MPESAHSLSTCRIPVSALTCYYRRILVGHRAGGHAPGVAGHRRAVRVAFEATGTELVVTVVEFAAHTVYLERSTGLGLLAVPRPEMDVLAPDDLLPEVARSGAGGVFEPANSLSLQTADRDHGAARGCGSPA